MGKTKICIDAGHYGKYNRSPVVSTYYESDMVWKLQLMQKEILESYGFEVILTRDDQAVDRKLYDRGYAAKGCVLFISNHSNACGTESVDYPVVYRGYDNIGNCNELAQKLAEVIASTMKTAQAGRTATRRGSSGGEYYGVLRGARAAGLSNYYILEHSFHTNTKMTKWLQKNANLRKLAEAECRVIAEHYGMVKGAAEDKGNAETAKKPETASSQAESGGQSSGDQQAATGSAQPAVSSQQAYLINTTCDALNIRSGPGTNHSIVGVIREAAGKKNKYTIVEEKDGWGRLKSGAGWIKLSYTRKV